MQASPFSRIPAELRNRIYEYALGCQTIHIEAAMYDENWPEFQPPPLSKLYHGFKRHDRYERVSCRYWCQTTICQTPYSDAELYDSTINGSEGTKSEDDDQSEVDNEEVNPFMDPFMDFLDDSEIANFEAYYEKEQRRIAGNSRVKHKSRHEVCINSMKPKRCARRPRLSLNLLRACRQIYEEASLIPFYDKNFSFASASTLDLFANLALQSKQCNALQTSRLWRTIKLQTMLSVETVFGLQQDTVDKLTGLSRINLIIDNFKMHNMNSSPRYWKCPDAAVKVILTPSLWASKRQSKVLRGLAEELEHALIRPKAVCRDHHQAREQLNALERVLEKA